MPDPPPGQRRLSILRSYTPADLLTLGNASCGALTIFACLSYIDDARSPQIEAAFVLPIVALVLDFFDGYVARLNPKRQSLLGADLDSLADIVSFGVAPAVLGYTLGLRGLGDVLCLTYFVCCGISRLARNCRRNGKSSLREFGCRQILVDAAFQCRG